MRKLPKLVRESAQRIAASNGVSVAAVIARYMAATKKASVSGDDFFWGHSDISPKRQNVRRRGSAARSGGVSRRRVAVKGDA